MSGNKCNLNCPFCSCSKRDRNLELSYEEIMDIMAKARKLGCESVTITGGGEPLFHRRIFDVIKGISDLGIEIGLVTNGTLLGTVPTHILSRIVWCRISSGDDREFTDEYAEMLDGAIERGKNVDWAFSHVVSEKPNYETITRLIKFANGHAFTHIRMVLDIFDPKKFRMDRVRAKLKAAGVDDRLVIYQARDDFVPGQEYCWISLLKPVIGADGYIYPCCGTQYALSNPARDYEKLMRMGHVKDLEKICESQAHFNGRICSKCYYSDYNNALKIMLSTVVHKKFV